MREILPFSPPPHPTDYKHGAESESGEPGPGQGHGLRKLKPKATEVLKEMKEGVVGAGGEG